MRDRRQVCSEQKTIRRQAGKTGGGRGHVEGKLGRTRSNQGRQEAGVNGRWQTGTSTVKDRREQVDRKQTGKEEEQAGGSRGRKETNFRSQNNRRIRHEAGRGRGNETRQAGGRQASS